MHAADKKPLEILNHLLGVNNNRIECFNFVTRSTDISVLKILFQRLTETSLICREELRTEVYKLGGTPLEGTMGDPEFLKAWLEVHAALNNNDHKGLLNSCCYEEGVVIQSYEEKLKQDEAFSSFQQQLLFNQYESLKADSEKVFNLRNALVHN